MESNAIIVVSLLFLVLVALAVYTYKMNQKNKAYIERFSKIIDVDKEFEKVTFEKQEIQKAIEELRASNKEKKLIFNNLVKEAAV